MQQIKLLKQIEVYLQLLQKARMRKFVKCISICMLSTFFIGKNLEITYCCALYTMHLRFKNSKNY